MRGDWKALMYLGDPSIRDAWRSEVEALLRHINPYTGVAWKDDPTIACVECYNEQEGGFVWSGFSPRVRELYTFRFRDWLRKKYGMPQALAQAWADRTILSLDAAEAPEAFYLSCGKSGEDFVLMCNELSRQCMS